jgi:leader peptidase (prepilin peptidase)/N-methyltransferase
MTPETTLLLLATIFGLVIGSFLNVCIHRIPLRMSLVSPPSRCPKCGRPVRWFDNIPVLSWILLGGKCRSCENRISAQYPMVELATGLAFLAVAWVTPPGLQLVARLIFVCLLVVLFGIDLEHQLLPDVITLPGIAIGLIFSVVASPGWQNALMGVVLGAGVLYAIAGAYYVVRRQEGLGMGDVKMLAMIGAFLGWQAVLVTLVLSSFAGALVGLGLMAIQRGSMKLALPYGTFLALGAVAAMLVGEPLIAWYVGFYR